MLIDTLSDELMQRVIRREFAGCTVLAVAYWLDTILDYGRMALLRAGELVGFDEPWTLLGRRGRFV